MLVAHHLIFNVAWLAEEFLEATIEDLVAYRMEHDSLIEKTKDYIKKTYNKPGNVFLGSVHRLDRPTSGLLIFARTSKALTRLNTIFRNNEINKTYLALTDRPPGDIKGELIHYLKKDQKKNKSFVVDKKVKDAKRASLSFEYIGEFAGQHLLKVKLHTGRHHQIRTQLGTVKCKIIGDLKYGYPVPNSDKSICLHCAKMDFIHPVKKVRVELYADLPMTLEWEVIRQTFPDIKELFRN